MEETEPGPGNQAAGSARAVAAQLVAAFQAGPDEALEALRSLYAASVELRHVPALASDGTVDGDRFDLRTVIVGTLTTGASVRIPTRMLGTVLDDRIVAIEHVMDAEAIAGWTDVATAGGLAVPAELDPASGPPQ